MLRKPRKFRQSRRRRGQSHLGEDVNDAFNTLLSTLPRAYPNPRQPQGLLDCRHPNYVIFDGQSASRRRGDSLVQSSAMRRSFLLATGAAVSALAVAGSAVGGQRTTNAPAIFTVKVTITDKGIAMSPNHGARGSTVTFILTNRGKKTRTFVI